MSIQICGELIHHIITAKRLNERQRKELLISYLPRIFPESTEISSAFAVGAETYVKTSKSSESQSNRGFIDTLLGQVILEFKENLSLEAKKAEAELELKRYVSSLWSSKGVTSSFACVASDVLKWNIYRPVLKEGSQKDKYTSDDVYLELVETATITSASESNSSLLFELLKKVIIDQYVKFLDSESLNLYFGFESINYSSFCKNVIPLLSEILKNDSEVELALELWAKQQEYNALDLKSDGLILYSKHLYLVLLARMIVAIHLVPERKKYDDKLLTSILDGAFFRKYKIFNYVERDYFFWINFERYSKQITPILRSLYHGLISFRIEESDNENILNDLYNELLPEDQKAFWGQKSTPVALAAKMIDEIDNIADTRILDPACGGGNFIKAFFKRLKNVKNITPKEVAASSTNFVGIDVDPVSVCISKSVWLLQVYNYLKKFTSTINIPIYHADSLFVLSDTEVKGRPHFVFDGEKIEIPIQILNTPNKMDIFVSWCQIVAYQLSKNDNKNFALSSSQLITMTKENKELDNFNFEDSNISDCALELISSLWKRIVEKRNGIWSFILRNAYRPTYLGGRFDVIVSNPPWLAMSSIPNIPYKKILESRALTFGIKPKGSAFLHTEIATLFFLHCVAFYLKDDGKSLCVLPRSIFNGDHHDNFRRSKYLDKVKLRINKIWDLEKVESLFKIPSVVLFSEKNSSISTQSFPVSAISFSGEVSTLIEERKYEISLNLSGNKSSWGEISQANLIEEESYMSLFRQGADLMPRTVCFVDIEEKNDDPMFVRTSDIELLNKNNKVLKGVTVEGMVKKEFVFRTLTSNYLLPFYVVKPLPYAVLPIKIGEQNNIEIIEDDELVNRGLFESNEWFSNIDHLLLEDGKEHFKKRLNARNKLTLQEIPTNGYMVHYGAGGKNPAAAVLECSNYIDFRFVADQTTYFFYTENCNEAHFVAGVLNSSVISEVIKSYQSKGSFGERHIHKLPLQFIPRFDSNKEIHNEISQFSKSFTSEIADDDDSRIVDVLKTIASRRKYFRKKYEQKLLELDAIVMKLFS